MEQSTIRERLKRLVEKRETLAGRWFDLFIQALIVLSLVSFSIETLPNLSSGTRQVLRWMEVGTVAIFTVEYLLRILVADSKPKFIFSFFGIVDLLAILPFYIAQGIDLRALRSFRFLRLFRTLKLARYSEAVQRIHKALLLAREELMLFLFLALLLLYISGVGIYYFENEAQPEAFASIFHSLWWSVATLTTVGYGDVYPITVGGKIFTFLVLIIGLGVVAVPCGMLASALSESRRLEGEGGDGRADSGS